ncbi:hypothetical protein QBC40DRAFT_300103 [Triangularia verruculosa]|uniref:Uncharacterized protein n=1 Tax=Triangularia verruculosa TaxID=2587418 RepID=A0AAN6XA04_9PEZI|nr:hypothetical protein QBC40DRAFT_300103 [Triangularia verruculosa]
MHVTNLVFKSVVKGQLVANMLASRRGLLASRTGQESHPADDGMFGRPPAAGTSVNAGALESCIRDMLARPGCVWRHPGMQQSVEDVVEICRPDRKRGQYCRDEMAGSAANARLLWPMTGLWSFPLVAESDVVRPRADNEQSQAMCAEGIWKASGQTVRNPHAGRPNPKKRFNGSDGLILRAVCGPSPDDAPRDQWQAGEHTKFHGPIVRVWYPILPTVLNG